MIGRTLGGYRVVEQIGLGGMATVYKAYDPNTERYVALKVLPQHYSHDPKFRKRFDIEAKAIAQLEHPRILPVHGYGEEDGIPYLVMRYMPTGTLKELIEQGVLSLEETSSLLGQIADALDYAHQHGILHRDVKPSNVLVDDRGNAYLTDFGIAKMVEGTLDLTGKGLAGTPQYMSPEQCEGRKDLTPATDIYSLGIVLYEMATGHPPFEAETPIAVIHKQLTEPLPPPRNLRPDLPEEAEGVILKALAHEPEQRWATCRVMAEAFERSVAGYVEAGALTREAPPGLGYGEPADTLPVSPPVRRRRVPVWVFGVVGVVLLAVLGGAALALRIFSPREPEPTPIAGVVSTEATPTPGPAEEATLSAAPIEPGATTTEVDEEKVTELPTETPPATPIPEYIEGEVLFEDDFEDGEADGWLADTPGLWSIIDDGTGNAVLSINNTTHLAQAIIVVVSLDWENYAFEARAMQVTLGTDDLALHILARHDPNNRPCQSYVAGFHHPNVTFWLGCDQGWTYLAARPALLTTGDWHDLRFEVFGSMLRFFFDGQVMLEAIDETLTAGGVGFRVTSGAETFYDDVRVIELVPPNAAQ